MRVEAARYIGEDNKGQKFAISRRPRGPAVQQSCRSSTIEGMRARLDLARGPLRIAALNGRYDLEQQKVAIDGPVRVAGPDGYQLATRDVTVDLDKRDHAVARPRSAARCGSASSRPGSFSADLDERTCRLNDGVRLKIEQGAVR